MSKQQLVGDKGFQGVAPWMVSLGFYWEDGSPIDPQNCWIHKEHGYYVSQELAAFFAAQATTTHCPTCICELV